MFEAIFPDGSKRLVNIEGEEFRGLSTGGQQLGRAAEVEVPKLEGIPEEEREFVLKNLYGIELAKGGIVTGPTRALIGEAGPEAVIPLDQYNRGKEGKTKIEINVTTGVGSDPVATGRAVVDAIKRYEATNGKVFVSA